jgi:SAM-dependent methyltransferase
VSSAEAYRSRRLTFGSDAELYERARPSYPVALIDQLVAWVGPTARIVDVACGTGRATALLAERGMTGVGIEPHPAMAAIARRKLADFAGWRIAVSDFEAWPPRPTDVPVDLVTCAQAWHWIDSDAGLFRAHHLLRPAGWLAMWWNWAESDPSPLREALDEVYARHGAELDFRSLRPPTTIPTSVPAEVPFGEPVERRYPWTETYSADGLVDFLGTYPNHALLPADQREALLGDVHAAVEGHGGRYVQHYVCHLWAAQRVVA